MDFEPFGRVNVKRWMRPFLLVTLVLLSACGDRAAQSGAAAGRASESQTSAWKQAGTRAASPALVPSMAYVVSPGASATDVPVFVRRPGATADFRIGEGTVVRGLSPDVLLVQRKDGHALAFRLSDGARPFSDRTPRGGHVYGAVAIGDSLYEFTYDELVLVDERGASRSLAIPAAIPTTTGPCRVEKGRFDLKVSSLNAMASVRGHPYLYVATMGNGAVIDLDGGRRLDLVDAGRAVSMIEGSDGKLYALTVDGRCASNHLMVRRIDVATMQVESIIDLGHGLPVEGASFVAASHGTYVHEVTATGAQLLRLDGAVVTSIPLPADSGLFEAAAPDGTIYLFGGRARNVITRFDPGTGIVTTVDAAGAPAGSFVTALWFDRPEGLLV
jgi:hypothetical protein